MSNQPILFLSPKLIGSRFEQHGLPLDILKDFTVLDEMVKSVAKTLYLKDNPHRQRVPKSFFDNFSLQIINLEKGSTVAKIALVSLSASSELLPPLAQEYAEKARDSIISTIEAAAQKDMNYQTSLTQTQLQMFNSFGSSLREGESIVFQVAQTGRNTTFTHDVRMALISRASLSSYQEPINVYGAMSEVDQDKKSFLLNTIEGLRLPVKKYKDNQVDDVIEAIRYYNQGRKILIHGIGNYSSAGRLESIEEVENITLLDANDIGYQLTEISALPMGWMDGKGVAFDKNQLDKLGSLFQEYYTFEKNPWLYPAQNHTLLAEWENGPWRLSMEINLSNLQGDFYSLNINNDQEISRCFNLLNSEHWMELCMLLREPEKGV